MNRITFLSATLAFVLLSSIPTNAQQPVTYALNPGDEIEVSVWQDAQLQRRVLIQPDGNFSIPLVGEIHAAGRSVSMIQSEIAAKLAKYIPEPIVTVSVVGTNGNRIYVIGQVNSPGSFVMNPLLTVVQALSLAGGTTPFAALNDILIIRTTKTGQRAYSFSLNDISRGRDLEQNIQLQSGDVIIVP